MKDILRIENLNKSYGDNKVLKGIDLKVHEGEIVGLLGVNGSGKTTLMNSICGITPFNKGNIFYKNLNLIKNQQLINNYGILIDVKFLDYLTAYENLKVLGMYSGIKDKTYLSSMINDILNTLGIIHKKNHYLNSFSYGQLQKLGVAQAMLGEKEMLILDEPFVGQDTHGIESLKTLLLKKAKTNNAGVLLSSHNFEYIVDICDKIAILKDGKIVYDNSFKENEYFTIIYSSYFTENELEYIKNKYPSIVIESKTSFVLENHEEFIKFMNHFNTKKLKDISFERTSLGEFFNLF